MSEQTEVDKCFLLTPGEFIKVAEVLPYKIYNDSWEQQYKDSMPEDKKKNIACMNKLYSDELFLNYAYIKIFSNDGIYGVNEHLHQLIKHCPGIYKTVGLLKTESIN